MHRASIGAAVVVGGLTMLSLPIQTAPQDRGGRPRTEQVNGREAAAGEILVKWRRQPGPSDLAALRSLADADQIHAVGRAGVRRVRSRSLDVTALLARLAGSGDIAYAEPNYVVHALTDPNDASYPQLWGLKNVGQVVNGSVGLPGADIHAWQAWDVSTGSTAHVVAVVDTGVDYTHPDLAANMWSAPSAFTVTIAGVPITCPAGSHGFDALALSCDPMDGHNHGTHVSGTIGASGNNGIGVVGVNWVTRLMAIRFLDASGSGTLADAINGIEFAIQAKQAFSGTGGADIRILSNSWGGRAFSQALFDEILATSGQDMLFVAAAGNENFSNDIVPMYPASYASPNVVSVAATTNTDTRAYFSNYGATSVHLGAPGVDVLSTTIGNTYASYSGTSMATPHVSGAAALVLSRCELDTAGLKDVLLSTVEPVAALASTTISGGRLDVNSAIRSCLAPAGTPTNLSASPGDSRVSLTWAGALGATRFTVKRGLSAGGPYTPLDSNVKTKAYTDDSVVNGTTYYYVVSAANPLGESGDSNEAFATPSAPTDLVVSAFTVPSTGGAGVSITVSDTTTNRGGVGAVASTTRFYLSANALLDGSDWLLSGAHDVPALAAGATSSASVSLVLPGDLTTGLYYVIAKADADGSVNETSESNNTSVRLLSIGPDLVVSSLAVPATGASGGTVLVTDTVRNQGGGAAGASTTRFYLSTNVTLDSGDVLLPEGRSVPGLAPGATNAGSTTVTLPPALATGSYYIVARADDANGVVETQETNNTSARQIQIGGDLVVSSLTVPSKGGAGSAILITDTTTNQGAGAIGASVTRFYLSTNALLDAGDTMLSGGRAVADLAAGAGSTGSTTVTIPPATATGTYYLFAKADADNLMLETQEGNNSTFRTIQIGGDLAVSALTVPASGGAGGVILVTDTTANQGAGAIASSVTRFFLSINSLLDAGDTPLDGSRPVPGLAAGGSSTGSTTVAIPASVAPGMYYVIAAADGDDSMVETQEGNNATARSIIIGPDLTVSSVSVVFSTAAGSTVTLTDVTINRGAAAAGASTTRVYLSTNLVLDETDVELGGGRIVPALAAGASSTGSTSITIPATTVPGTYFLCVRADADGSVTEGQESNNIVWRTIQVTAPR